MIKQIICFFRGHKHRFVLRSPYAWFYAHLSPELKTAGICERCGYTWNTLRPDDYLDIYNKQRRDRTPSDHLK